MQIYKNKNEIKQKKQYLFRNPYLLKIKYNIYRHKPLYKHG